MKRQALIATASLFAMALTTAPAYAGGDSGFYIGGGIGQGYIGDVDGESFDGDDTGYKAIAGFNFGTVPLVDLGIEANYIDFGKPTDAGIEIEAEAIAAYGLAGINFGPIGVFGKVGAVRWDAKASDGEVTVKDDGTDVAYGAGIRFQVASFQIRAEYELFDVDEIDDFQFVSASLLYTF